MQRSVPIGQLRQNPTEVLRAVEEGASFVITNHRRPIADLVPHRSTQGISGTELMNRLHKAHADDVWLHQLAEGRAQESGRDPWQ